jgi:hypothetical protein
MQLVPEGVNNFEAVKIRQLPYAGSHFVWVAFLRHFSSMKFLTLSLFFLFSFFFKRAANLLIALSRDFPHHMGFHNSVLVLLKPCLKVTYKLYNTTNYVENYEISSHSL